MSGSTTRRLAGLAGAAVLVLGGCAGPRHLDTGAPLVAGAHGEAGVLWERDLGRALEFPPLAVEQSWLVVVTEGPLHRVRQADGENLWRRKLPGPATGAPVLCGAVAAIGLESPADEIMGIALDDGQEIWKIPGRGALLAGADGVLVAAGRGGWVARLDPATGEEVWRQRLPGAGWRSPVLRPGEDQVLISVRPDSVAALSLADGARRWCTRVGPWARLSANPTGALVAAADDSTLTLLAADSGRVLVRTDLDAMPAGAPVVEDGRVVVALRAGVVEVRRASDLTGLWTRALAPPLVSSPAVEGDLLVQTGPRGRIHIFDLEGEVRGEHRHPERLVSAGCITPTMIAVGGAKGTLVAYGRTP